MNLNLITLETTKMKIFNNLGNFININIDNLNRYIIQRFIKDIVKMNMIISNQNLILFQENQISKWIIKNRLIIYIIMTLINKTIMDLITDFLNMNLEINNLNQIQNLKLLWRLIHNLLLIRSHKQIFLISLNFLSGIRIKKRLISRISKILDLPTSINPLHKPSNNPKLKNNQSHKLLLKLRYLLLNNSHKIYWICLMTAKILNPRQNKYFIS